MKSNVHSPRISWDHNIAMMRYGELWRYHRKICMQHFNKEAVNNYHGIMLQKVHEMLGGLLKSPKKFKQHNKMYAALITL
jgi:cytochrome P450